MGIPENNSVFNEKSARSVRSARSGRSKSTRSRKTISLTPVPPDMSVMRAVFVAAQQLSSRSHTPQVSLRKDYNVVPEVRNSEAGDASELSDRSPRSSYEADEPRCTLDDIGFSSYFSRCLNGLWSWPCFL